VADGGAGELVLVGEGGGDLDACEDELRRYVAQHTLEGRVRFTGAVDNVPDWLRAADAFVFPTENEAFGLSLVEAMACGLPSVSTVVGGLAEIVQDGVNALVVSPARYGGLATGAVETHGGCRALRSPRRGGSPAGRSPLRRGRGRRRLRAAVSRTGRGPRRSRLVSGPRSVDPDLTLLIPTLGRDLLRGTLETVVGGSRWPACVIVVDQGRNPATEVLAAELRRRGLDVTYVPSTRTGRSAGLNDGLERVATAYVAITDDDCPVAPDWIERLGARLRRHEGAIVTGRVDAGEGEVQLSVVTSDQEEIQRRPSLKYDRLSGGNMGMAMAVARRVGPFTESPAMRTAEDGEFAYRALRVGVPIVYAPEVVVRHLGWRGEGERDRQYRSYGLSQGGFFGHYLRRGDLFIALRVLVHVARALRRWAAGALRGDRDLAANGRAYVTGLLPGLRAGWRKGAARR
jgi:GT2 family glycosyltransferase